MEGSAFAGFGFMNFWRNPIFIGIIVVSLVLAIGWSIYSNNAKKKSTQTASQQTTGSTTTTISNLTNFDPSDFKDTTQKEYALAQSKAVTANAQNQLGQIEAEIGSSLLPADVNTRYLFTSPADSVNNWMITISETSQSFIRALIPKEDYAGNITAINTANWKYNFVTALQLAERNGGQSWRDSNTLTGVKMTLKNNGAGTLIWLIDYSSGSSDFTITLNAIDGTIITS